MQRKNHSIKTDFQFVTSIYNTYKLRKQEYYNKKLRL